MNIVSLPKNEIAQQTAKEISELLKKFKAKPILLLLSGGSAFEIYDHIKILDQSNITVSVLDERFSDDPHVNNFIQLSETIFFKTHDFKFIDTRVKNKETLNQFSHRFESNLKKWKNENPGGLMIAVAGIGPDGHTSGIMPYPEDNKSFEKMFDQTENWVVGYDATNKNPYPLRATTTIPFLKKINYSFVYVADKKKKEILKKVLEKNKPLNEIPGRIINQMKNVELFVSFPLD